MCGNSICQDRASRQHDAALEAFFHYRKPST